MAEDAASKSPDVVLGFDAARGFAPADQTSPALAGAACALTDVAMPGPVTEVRIHGVSGSNGPTMLEHPQALQVAGDSVTGFYRRWSPDGAGRPSVPWKLEAYSWGGLTEAPLASASWLLMAPFMMYNVAYFMLPPAAADGNRAAGRAPVLHRIAGMALRLLALAATVQFVSAATSALVSTVAWQAAGRPGIIPSWMGWYGAWTAGWRVALALAAVAAIIGGLWRISVTTASKYEARISTARPVPHAAWPLTERGFWRGQALVSRQRLLHVAAACAAVALIVALPVRRPAAAGWVMVALDAAVLAAAAFSTVLPLADHHAITIADGGDPPKGRADGWCLGVLAAGAAVLVATALVAGLTDRQPGPQVGALPGLTGFLVVLLAAQAALIIALTAIVIVLARQAADHRDDDVPPYLGGNLATLLTALGFALGGLLTAVASFGMARLLGTPVPSGFRFAIPPTDALAVPWPIYAFGAAPVGLLCGAVAAGILLFLRCRRNRGTFGTRSGDDPSPVAAAYADLTAGAPGDGGDDVAYAKNRSAIARAWAIGLMADDADAATALAVGGTLVVALAAIVALAVTAGPAGHPTLLGGEWHGLATLVALLGILVAGWLVMLLRQDYSNTARRKTIGALWDVGTFWPRAVHPLAPPCYSERAVPEVVDRIRLLTGRITNGPDDVAALYAEAGQIDLQRTRGLTVPSGPVLLTGYSQGSIIAPAVVAQLPPDVLHNVALLTLACPARRLYGRAFPAYFGRRQLAALAGLLDAAGSGDPRGPDQAPGRWKNLRRRSDFIGSWVFAEPPARLDEDDLRHDIDQPCWDPVALVQDANPTPPPVHRHSQFWPDPRTGELGTYLVNVLADQLVDVPAVQRRFERTAESMPSPDAAPVADHPGTNHEPRPD
jgi:hypothetical protein